MMKLNFATLICACLWADGIDCSSPVLPIDWLTNISIL